MNNYFTGDFEIDSALMYDYLDDLELKTGNERSGTKFFSRNNKRNHVRLVTLGVRGEVILKENMIQSQKVIKQN